MDERIPGVPASRARAHPSCAAFEFKSMNKLAAVYAVYNWLCKYPRRECLMAAFRVLLPIVRIPGWGVVVFRADDVREVLEHDREFPVPWAGKMVELSQHKNFLLGMENGPEYQRNYQQLAQAFQREDVAQYVVPMSARISADILRGRSYIDVMRELIWQVPAQLCEDYYGIEIPDKHQFTEWTIAMSGYLFAPLGDKTSSGKTLALAGAECFRNVIRRAIAITREDIRQKRRVDGIILPRLLSLQDTDKTLTDEVLEADLFGMVTGFVPTNLLAAGNLLLTLLDRKDFMAETRRAALGGDDDTLWRCLRETMRFRNLNLGPFRKCGSEGYTLAAGTFRAMYLKRDMNVLASTQSAMFDRRRVTQPRRFNPNRAAEDYMVFGHGQHRCMNAYMAAAQITQMFKVLLRMPEMRRARGKAGKLRTTTVFPASLTVEFIV